MTSPALSPFSEFIWIPLYTQALIVFGIGLLVGWLVTWISCRSRFGKIKLKLETDQRIKDSELQHQTILHREQLRALEQSYGQMSDSFKSMSADALRSSQETFLSIAKETLAKEREVEKNDMEKRKREIDDIVKPVSDSLTKVDQRIVEMEKAREGAYRELRQQVTSMSDSQVNLQKETGNLVRALRQPIGRGQWGEMQLRRVVEMAGMQEHCDFTLQPSTTTDEGSLLRPDLVVKLPGDKVIVVDAKTPMEAYLDAIEARENNDDEATRHALIRHAQQVKAHIRELGKKSYQNQFDSTPEFTVLFLPSESFFSDALNQDPGLIENGISQGVILATPTTLIALLRAVSYGWRQESLTDNAREICELGHEMYDRLAKMGEHFAKLGKNLTSSVDSYNQAMGTLETRVLVSARKFRELGASPDSSEKIEAATKIESQPRDISSSIQ